MVGGKASPARIRKVALEDLMKREAVTLDDAGLHDLLTGQVVLVTGAGGSIGSELCRQIAAFQPAMLVLYEMNEYAMYKIDEDLREAFPELPVESVVGDIKNARRVNQVMHQYSPSLVFHAAAYKHVPLMEEANASEAVQNNVLGTYVVARAAIDYGVKKFVFVSTDKAVNPTNVMGATKRLAEMVCQSLQAGSTTTRFEMVRFGNVLGSAGSVIPRFQEQIDKGGPVTVTGPPRSICSWNFGMTLPALPSTLPKRTISKRVLAPACSAWHTISPRRLVAPITLGGLTALSVEMKTNFLTPNSIAARATT
jgi:FlaA1/EpsC-like NDP-sugar epimerase